MKTRGMGAVVAVLILSLSLTGCGREVPSKDATAGVLNNPDVPEWLKNAPGELVTISHDCPSSDEGETSGR